MKLKDFLFTIKKYFLYYVLKKNYYRVGKCNACGRCCEKIYVKHGKFVIENEAHFEKLKKLHRFYDDLEVVGHDDIGLIFACKNLDKETRLCKIHKLRAKICRNYPQEEIFLMGGEIAKTCGYQFIPLFTFEEVLQNVKKC